MGTRGLTVVEVAAVWALLAGPIRPAGADDGKPGGNPPAAYAVETHADICYRTDKDADKDRHTLDLYCPKGKKSFPVVLFVHGGSWKSGSKGLYTGLGEAYAKAGIGVAICNYRLSPKVQHPAHVEDVARAFAWVCENAARYGGDPKNLFLCGHSAGGHLVSLLATDPEYLKAEKRSVADIKGVVSISGVYQIVPTEAVFRGVFGADAEACKKASPLTWVSGKLPPFLLAYGDKDYPRLDEMARNMCAALKKADSPVELLSCKGRNHLTIIINFIDPDDPLNKAFREFVTKNSK